jgi:hypothetical protein
MVCSGHPLVGTWVEEDNPIDTTTVVHAITAKEGSFFVSDYDRDHTVNEVWKKRLP